MKKKLMIPVMVMTMAFSVLGCGKEEIPDIPEEPETEEVATEEEETVAEDEKEEEESGKTADVGNDSEGEDILSDDHFDISGCDTFTDIVNKMSDGRGYANEKMGDTDVFLLSSGTYDDMEGHQAAIDAEIYIYDEKGNIQYIGTLGSAGTAYPLILKDGYLYVGSHHSIARYTVKNNKLFCEDEASESFDSDGNATYYYYSQDPKGKEYENGEIEDDTLMNELFTVYEDGTVINFQPVE